MKRFFIIILVLFFLTSAFSGWVGGQSKINHLMALNTAENESLASDTVSDTETEMAKKILSFPKAVQQLHIDAQNLPASQATDISKYNILTPMYLMQKEAGLFSGTKGYGGWFSLPFGQVRFVSCRTGLDEYATPLLSAVQTQIKPDWVLYKPSITVITPVQQVAIPYPLIDPLPSGKTKTDTYTAETFFPVIVEPISIQESMTLLVRMDWQAEHLTTKEKQSGQIELLIPFIPEPSYETGICPLLREQLSLTPAPAEKMIQTTANLGADNTIQFFFNFEKATTRLSIQIDKPWTFSEIEKNIQSHRATLIIKPSEPVKAGQIIPLKIITSFGRFSADVVVQTAPFVHLTEDFSWIKIIYSGILLFFATPLFGWLLRQTPRTQKQMRHEAKKTIFSIAITGIVLTILWQLNIWIPTDIIQIWPFSTWIFIGAFLALIIWPLKSLFSVLVMTFILPKPYINNIVFVANDYPWMPLACGFVWTALCLWPFWWIIKYPNGWFAFYKKSKKYELPLQSVIGLPLLVMTLWLIVAGGVNSVLNTTIPPYNAQDLQTLLKNNKKVALLIEPTVCFTCAWNKGVELNGGYTYPHIQSGHLIPMHLNANTAEALQFRQRFGQKSLPMILLFTPDMPNGQPIQDGLNNKTWKKIINR